MRAKRSEYRSWPLPLAQMPVPAGQPPWVFIVVALLGLIGVLGVAYLTNKAKRPSSPESAATVSSSNADAQALLAIEHLAKMAQRATDREEAAQQQVQDVRAQLQEAERRLSEVEGENARLRQRLLGGDDQ